MERIVGEGSWSQVLMTKSEFDPAISMLQTIFSKHQKGEVRLEQAKQLGAELLRGLPYGKDEYFRGRPDRRSQRSFMAERCRRKKQTRIQRQQEQVPY